MGNPHNNAKPRLRLATVDQAAEVYPFTRAQLRAWIFRAERYGLEAAIIRRVGRVYLDLDRFERWLEEGRAA